MGLDGIVKQDYLFGIHSKFRIHIHLKQDYYVGTLFRPSALLSLSDVFFNKSLMSKYLYHN